MRLLSSRGKPGYSLMSSTPEDTGSKARLSPKVNGQSRVRTGWYPLPSGGPTSRARLTFAGEKA